MRTPIIRGARKPFPEVWAALADDVQERWGVKYLKREYSGASKTKFIELAEDPIKVVRALQHAVINTPPEIRYRPSWESNLLFFALSMLSAGFVEWILANLSKSKMLPVSVV